MLKFLTTLAICVLGAILLSEFVSVPALYFACFAWGVIANALGEKLCA